LNVSQNLSSQPECAKWNLWVGDEVEGGNGQLGVKTLFVRDATESFIIQSARDHRVKRIWFCKEFLVPIKPQCRVIDNFIDEYDVAVEVDLRLLGLLPDRICRTCQLFLKLPLPNVEKLKKGDFVCIGGAFNDVLLNMSDGLKMNPELYKKDTRIS